MPPINGCSNCGYVDCPNNTNPRLGSGRLCGGRRAPLGYGSIDTGDLQRDYQELVAYGDVVGVRQNDPRRWDQLAAAYIEGREEDRARRARHSSGRHIYDTPNVARHILGRHEPHAGPSSGRHELYSRSDRPFSRHRGEDRPGSYSSHAPTHSGQRSGKRHLRTNRGDGSDAHRATARSDHTPTHPSRTSRGHRSSTNHGHSSIAYRPTARFENPIPAHRLLGHAPHESQRDLHHNSSRPSSSRHHGPSRHQRQSRLPWHQDRFDD